MSEALTSVIISTYNQPDWLILTLTGYEYQTFSAFEIVIADDGSNTLTKSRIEEFQKTSSLKITHVWHKDDGFQKTKILNKAIMACKGQYLIFTDGDCIPREDFVKTHIDLKREKCFLSGGYFKLPLKISQLITKKEIQHQSCFKKEWLLEKGLKPNFKLNKLTSYGAKEWLLNRLTPTKATWDGMNSSGFKKDILDVNGFDERMQYGGEDRELGERLINKGIKPVQIRYSAICVHLDHDRGYADKNGRVKNNAIRKLTKQKKSTWTDFGIKK